MSLKSTRISVCFLAVLIFFLDQFSKQWIMQNFVLGECRYITSFFNLRYSTNPGITFGMFHMSSAAGIWLLISLAAIVLLIIVRAFWNERNILSALAFGMVLGGGIANIWDRINLGKVIDFLDFHVLGYHWYTFNFADSAIVLGVVVLILQSYRGKNA